MWECKNFPLGEQEHRKKRCIVEVCPMEHWVNSHIIGEEWELWVEAGCNDCPLIKLLGEKKCVE